MKNNKDFNFERFAEESDANAKNEILLAFYLIQNLPSEQPMANYLPIRAAD